MRARLPGDDLGLSRRHRRTGSAAPQPRRLDQGRASVGPEPCRRSPGLRHPAAAAGTRRTRPVAAALRAALGHEPFRRPARGALAGNRHPRSGPRRAEDSDEGGFAALQRGCARADADTDLQSGRVGTAGAAEGRDRPGGRLPPGARPAVPAGDGARVHLPAAAVLHAAGGRQCAGHAPTATCC